MKNSSVLTALLLPMVAGAQPFARESAYAIEACRAGCFAVTTPGVFYTGVAARAYRVCTVDAHTAIINANGGRVTIPAGTAGAHGCVDISGSQLILETGQVWVGVLPD
ncbi:MAG: hypothetical protein EPO06_05275 [Burkholderiaceae bacterium]|nr:MAG: hypothetical protein EPO06_05275 [Burkholderiaceae bacterium]